MVTRKTRKTKQPKIQSFKVTGENIMGKIKELIKEGNVRRIVIKNKNGKSIAEFPLTLGVVGTIIAPVLAAIGAVVALVKECTITVEKG